MDMNEFNEIVEIMGINNIQMFIFDNSMRWMFDEKAVPPDPNNGYKGMDPVPMVPVSEQFEIVPNTNFLRHKEYYPTHSKWSKDKNKYYWTYRHIENLQAIVCIDGVNGTLQGHFDVSST